MQAETQARFKNTSRYDDVIARTFPGSLTLAGFPDEVRASFLHRATKEDSIVPEARIVALLTEAGFGEPMRIFQAQHLGGWLAQRR